MEDPILEIPELSIYSSHAATLGLEQGKVVFLPNDGFGIRAEEQILLDENLLARGKKNISYDVSSKKIRYLHPKLQDFHHDDLQKMLDRFSDYAKSLVDSLMPSYQPHLRWGRTSYRPAKISGRKTSVVKDDTRLHVDAFKSTPVKGQRILRVFANIHPNQGTRVWNLGEAFPDVLTHFLANIKPYSHWKAALLNFSQLTKTKRSAYDHFMLQLHDAMKKDNNYQAKVAKTNFHFPAQSSWIVFTDQVSHAALDGQFLLEQTFYLPVEAMQKPALSPLYHWQAKFPTETML